MTRHAPTRSWGSIWLIAMLFLLLLLAITPVHAQQIASVPNHTYEVYLERDVMPDGSDRLIFIDLLTGDSVPVLVNGERYTPVADSILFYDAATATVRQASPDGSVVAHPFVQLTDGAQRVDWVVSPDERLLAWTLTYAENDTLRTITQIADPSGANQQSVLEDGVRSGVRLLPVAFTMDNSALIMDAHPDGLGRFAPYTQYAGLFRVSIPDGEIAPLPDEPGCFCGAAVRAGLFLRLALTDDLSGFDVVVQDLRADDSRTIEAARPNNGTYTQAGDILISSDGRRAVYALSQIENFGAETQSVRTIFMLVNLETMTQTPLTDPVTTYVHPVRWTEENAALLFTSPQRAGTWKITLADGVLTRVADASFIGVLHTSR